MRIEFTDQEVIQAIEKAVSDNGTDWQDPLAMTKEGSHESCKYWYEMPGEAEHYCCIVGQTFENLGIDMEWARYLDASVSDLMDHTKMSPYHFSMRIIGALESAQVAQDAGKTWGRALEIFHANF